MKLVKFTLIYILSYHTAVGQIIWPKSTNGLKIGGLASAQQINNIPTLVPLSKGDTILDHRTGSITGKFGFSLSYFHNMVLSKHLSLYSNGGYRKRGFISDTRYDSDYNYAVPSEHLSNQLNYLFADLGFRLHTAADRSTIWFIGYSNRFDVLVYQRLPFWGGLKPYKRVEFSIVGQGGFGFFYTKDKKRCFIEFEINPGIANALKRQKSSFQSSFIIKPAGYYPPYPTTLFQKYAYNYSIGLNLSVEL